LAGEGHLAQGLKALALPAGFIMIVFLPYIMVCFRLGVEGCRWMLSQGGVLVYVGPAVAIGFLAPIQQTQTHRTYSGFSASTLFSS
jgi:hypothetical protein